ncbi:MAG TPA: hypothetical protein VGF23_18250 [Gaiellaceae bacterium]
MAEEQRLPSEEELRDAVRQLKVSDVLQQTIVTISSLGYAKLAPDTRDLEQARIAIEALRALVPVLEGAVPADTTRDLNQVVANLQLAYASAAAKPEPEPEPEPAPEPEPEAEAEPTQDEAD